MLMAVSAWGQEAYNGTADPVADEAAVVQSSHVRFTVLTPRMIRIQYSSRDLFEDRATFAVINRRLPVPSFAKEERDGYLYITPEALRLRYRIGSNLSATTTAHENLRIDFDLNGRTVTWYPGRDDAFNLMGTTRTLDADIGDTRRVDLEKGLLSRDGWAIIDESPRTKRGDGSTTFAFDDSVDGIPWVAEPIDKTATDWYFMGYGHDYKGALQDYVKVAGRQPLPPLYMLGYWYSKYQRYSQQDFINLVNEMKQNEIPIDVMIMDMDWHLDGWTGWTWNKQLIPNPVGLITWMHRQGLKVSLNLHPADGVGNHEDHFSEIRNDLGLPATETRVPWQLENPVFYQSFFSHIIREREKEGVDFWWIDWQQDLLNPTVSGLSQTFWLNHVFYNDMAQNRQDRRPVIFHRWGGLGSHRYPIGFSGDTFATFGTLAFEPYFTSTASNVCFGYWGHDLGAHLQVADPDPELYLRWLQYGVFSPIFRTHGASQANNERRIWKYPNFPLLLDAVNLRYELTPYIYTCAHEAFETGVSICRPLYYEYPEDNRSYSNESEYFFGPDMLVAPVCTAAEDGERASRDVWLPEGTWYDVCRSRLLQGDMEFTDRYAQDEIPYFVRAGSIVPCSPAVSNLKTPTEGLLLKVYPGADGTGTLYEDDGDSQAYLHGAFSTTSFSQRRLSDRVILTIEPRTGTFPDMPAQRSWQVMFYGVRQPLTVTVDGTATDDWEYDADKELLTVSVPAASCDVQTMVEYTCEPTVGIHDPAISTLDPQSSDLSPIYDLQGRQVSQPSSNSLNIINGKKTIWKK